jgi:hypothetical protein
MRLGLDHQLAFIRLKAELRPLMLRRPGLLTMTFVLLGLAGCGALEWIAGRTPGERMTGSPERTWAEYSACLPRGRTELPVHLRVRIYRQAQELLTDVQPKFLIRPGRWTVDATVSTPLSAPDGPYRMRIDMSGAIAADAAATFTMHR